MRSPRKPKPRSGSNSKLIVLHENPAKDDEPVPLSVYDPRSPGEVCFRRLPMFDSSSEETKSPNVAWEPDSAAPTSLKRSPRFPPSPVEPKSSNVAPKLNKKRASPSPISLRRSPRFDPSPIEVKESTSVARNSGQERALIMAPTHCLRRSPRFDPTPEEVKGTQESRNVARNSDQKRALIAPMYCLRRSPRFDSSPAEVKETRESSNVGRNSGKIQALVAPPDCLRRSPRYSGAATEPILSALADCSESRESKKVKRDSGNSDARMSPRFSPLVVAVENAASNSANDKSRRSKGQNLTSIVSKAEINPNVDCLEENCLRRSPRYNLTQSGTKSCCLEVIEEKNLPKELQSQKRGLFELESLQPSTPKMLFSEEEDRNIVIMPLRYDEPDLFAGKDLRSPRPPLTGEDTISEDIRKVIMELSNEHGIMPPEFSSTLATDESIRLDTLDKLSDLSDDCPSKSVWTSRTSHQMISEGEAECNLTNLPEPYEKQPPKEIKTTNSLKNKTKNPNFPFFIGDPIPDDEAQERWRWRYEMKTQRSCDKTSKLNDDEEDEVVLNVQCHFAQANVGNCVYTLGDCAYIRGDGKTKHVGRIVEFFETTDGEKYFRVQWFYTVEDTVIKEEGAFHDKRRLFYSTIMNDNLIDCIISKVNVTKITPRVGLKINSISPADFYYDMEYCIDYSTFRSCETDNSTESHYIASPYGTKTVPATATETYQGELTLLDLYSGCGGMSTGLCLGGKVSGVNLVTRWALDNHKSACESLKLNHPETNVRNEAAEDFLELLKEWEKLCKRYRLSNVERTHPSRSMVSREAENDNDDSTDEFEVSKLVDICYGDPNNTGKRDLHFKVHWEGYSTTEDTWEPVEGLSNCKERIQEFVRDGMKMKILPLPADVDIICGGPPCQGISGYNRFRNVDSPLDDERNRQIVVFMDIVNFLKPKYVLMENVLDILKFDKGSLGRYALSRLVNMNYQARLGIIAAGCYGLPQFRLRVFLWGALPHENLPQFPLPTHDVIIRYWPPPEFERNTVAYDEEQPRDLEDALVLQDAISDLPAVTNNENREKISYEKHPETEFQRYIRSPKLEMAGSALNGTTEYLYDHRPYPLFEDDYLRVCKIPKRKGANFRDLAGVIVGSDNVVRRDPNINILLPSGKPLVPDYTFTYEQGKSKRPFARLWWDETVPTVVTFPNCHNQVALHPGQDRILTIREYARLQGFPDYYRFCGTVKQRYCQVGNAVPVNVSRALGYALGLAIRKLSSNEPVFTLPHKFSLSNYSQLTKTHASHD